MPLRAPLNSQRSLILTLVVLLLRHRAIGRYQRKIEAQREPTLHNLIARADHALYRAKQTGRNRVCMEMARSQFE